ncbi:MAG: stage II sporulation protein M [Candidatus Woesearchaeota archaeon]
MVLEQFLDRKIVVKHSLFVFVLSAIYVFIAYAVQQLFFPADQGLAVVLLVTILLVPSLHHLIIIEEKLESRGAGNFWKRHRTIIKCYLGAFLGLLAGFLTMGFILPGTLGYQQHQLSLEHLKPETITTFLGQPYTPDTTTALALFSHNLMYLLFGFVLSIFYGAGAIFLVAYNASFFAAFVVELFARWSSAAQLTAVSFVHLLPESAGYILTAIAGAEISRALIHEKLSAQPFRNVLKNCFLLLAYAILLILLAAFLEAYVTAPYFHRTI